MIRATEDSRRCRTHALGGAAPGQPLGPRYHPGADEPERNELVAGRVLLREGGKLGVTLEGRRARACNASPPQDVMARRAASCLLCPEPGDRVLVALLPDPYVLAVLERDGSRVAELGLPGDVSLMAGGRLGLGGHEGVDVTSEGKISLLSRVLEVHAADGRIALERVTAVAKAARAHLEKLDVVAHAYDLVAERIGTRVKRIYRFVEEIDQLRARHLDYRAQDTAQIRGTHTVISAKQVAKIDGEQVHIG
jgi:hypothetical protein